MKESDLLVRWTEFYDADMLWFVMRPAEGAVLPSSLRVHAHSLADVSLPEGVAQPSWVPSRGFPGLSRGTTACQPGVCLRLLSTS